MGQQVELVLPYEQSIPGGSVVYSAQVVRVESRGRYYGVAVMYKPVAFTIPA